MSVYLLGGEGFIGHNIVDVISPTMDCVCVDKKQSTFCTNNHKTIILDTYNVAMPTHGDVFIHLVDHQTNLVNFFNDEKGVVANVHVSKYKHVLLISSAAVYAKPNSDYGKRKLALEEIYYNYCHKNNIPLAIVRIFNVFGKYQWPNKPGSLISTLIVNALQNHTTIIQDMEAERDFVLASDVAQSIKIIIKEKLEGIIDIGTGHLTKIKDVVEIINKLIAPDTCLIQNNNTKETIQMKAALQINNLTASYVSMEKGLQETICFYKKNLDKFYG